MQGCGKTAKYALPAALCQSWAARVKRRSLLGLTALVGQMTLVSRILGLARDSVIAAVFGASSASDAFFVAFRIPNVFRRLFAEGAFSQAFVPVLTTYRTGGDAAEVQRMVNAVFGALGAALLGVTTAGVLLAPVVIAIVAPGFVGDAAQFGLGVDLLRLTFPYLLFIALTALLGGVLNTYGHFAVPAITPALLNVALIACALWVAPRLPEPIFGLAFGVLLGGVLQFALQFTAARRLGFTLWPRLDFSHPGVRRILRLMGPAVFGVSIGQINILVDTLIASFLVTGSISWLYFADRLMEFPLGIFGIALGTVILPHLSEYHARTQDGLFSDTLDWALRLTVVVTVPAAVGLAALATPILSTLFQYGMMSEHDVAMSARALVTYSLGLTGFILVKIAAPGFYARQDTRTPVRIGLIALVTNVALNALFVWPLGHAGLALATSLAAFVNGGLLLRVLYREGVYQPRAGWSRLLGQVLIAAAAMGLLLHWIAGEAAIWSAWTLAERGARLALLIVAGGAVYGILALALGLRPADMAQPRPQV